MTRWRLTARVKWPSICRPAATSLLLPLRQGATAPATRRHPYTRNTLPTATPLTATTPNCPFFGSRSRTASAPSSSAAAGIRRTLRPEAWGSASAEEATAAAARWAEEPLRRRCRVRRCPTEAAASVTGQARRRPTITAAALPPLATTVPVPDQREEEEAAAAVGSPLCLNRPNPCLPRYS